MNLDAICPLTLQDFPRFKILRESLECLVSGLGTLWLISPDSQLAEIQSEIAGLNMGLKYRMLADSAVVPEFALFPDMRGWQRQQLVKLAMADHVETDFYLTLDADVMCTRPLALDELVKNGRGMCYVIETDLYPEWYSSAEVVIGMKARRQGILHNVTPTVLNRHAVKDLARHLDQRWLNLKFSLGRRGLKQLMTRARTIFRTSEGFVPWRMYLGANVPWTEYALYYTFLEAAGSFDRYHVESPECIYDIRNSAWHANDVNPATWDPAPLFSGEGPPWFLVLQSTTQMDPGILHEKISPLLHDRAVRSK